MKTSIFLFMASVLAMLVSESLWIAPLVALFAAMAIRDLLFRLPPSGPMGELGVDFDEEADRLAERFDRFRKALHN